MIHLIGPGGAGKTTSGIALAEHLNVQFVDLDAEFILRYGDISAFIDRHSYEAYARHNVNAYLALLDRSNSPDIVALSSGFMVYRADIHPEYAALRERIASSRLSFVLLPSLDLEKCVAEIVRRQLQRPFARTPSREEGMIRSRFPLYVSLPTQKVITQGPIATVVKDIVTLLPIDAVHSIESGKSNYRN